MTVEIEVTTDVTIGGKPIDKITVEPFTFANLVSMWRTAILSKNPQAALQRERIKHQVHFMSGDERVVPDDADISALPLQAAKQIINQLDVGQGTPGQVINEGDGILVPIVYRLGTPIEAKSGKTKIVIQELEFQAATYGQVENVLAAENEMAQTYELLRTAAKPVGTKLSALPTWALEKITTADGVSVLKEVLPHF